MGWWRNKSLRTDTHYITKVGGVSDDLSWHCVQYAGGGSRVHMEFAFLWRRHVYPGQRFRERGLLEFTDLGALGGRGA